MKKLLLIAATSATILSSSAFGDCPSMKEMNNEAPMMMSTTSDQAGQFYVKGLVGATKFDAFKGVYQGINVKAKSKVGVIAEIGAGYYVTDIFRADVTFAMPIANQFKKTVTSDANPDLTNDISVKIKPTLASLLVNGYVDVLDAGMAKFFVGAGIGMSYVKTKITTASANPDYSGSGSTKKKYNFAWQGSVGASTKVADGVNAELVYSYRDYGKSKDLGKRYKGHNVMVGVRVDV